MIPVPGGAEGEKMVANPLMHWRPPVAPDERGGVPLGEYLAAFMHRLGANLKGVEVSGYPQFRLGPFIYNKPIQHRRNAGDLLINGLLFYAVQEFKGAKGARDWTRDSGAPMPRDGKANWKLAVAYVKDVVGQTEETLCLDTEAARKRLGEMLRRNPSIGFMGFEPPETRND